LLKLAERKVEKCLKLEYNNTLSEIEIEGGVIMETLAQRLRDEGKEKWMKEAKLETAKRMLNDGLPIESIIKYTGLTEDEVKALMS
jgi:predicted transposase/invertase (TIGR01784 family)